MVRVALSEMRGVCMSRMCDEKCCMSRVVHEAHEHSRMPGRQEEKKNVEKIHNCGSCASNTHTSFGHSSITISVRNPNSGMILDT